MAHYVSGMTKSRRRGRRVRGLSALVPAVSRPPAKGRPPMHRTEGLGRAGWVVCRRVGKLTAAKEKKLPDVAFGLVKNVRGKKVRKYPMPDPKHAASAKGRAKTQLKRGSITKREYNAIVRKADRVINSCKRGKKR